MIKVDQKTLDHMERLFPGILDNISQFEDAKLPACPRCGSGDTADVQCGVIGRTIHIAAATTKFKLIPNPPKPGEYFCNGCKRFFTPKKAKGWRRKAGEGFLCRPENWDDFRSLVESMCGKRMRGSGAKGVKRRSRGNK